MTKDFFKGVFVLAETASDEELRIKLKALVELRTVLTDADVQQEASRAIKILEEELLARWQASGRQ